MKENDRKEKKNIIFYKPEQENIFFGLYEYLNSVEILLNALVRHLSLKRNEK